MRQIQMEKMDRAESIKSFELDAGFLMNYNRYLKEMPDSVLLAGAGRWGRILCRVLLEGFPGLKRVMLVAERNYTDAKEWLEKSRIEKPDLPFHKVSIARSISGIPSDKLPQAAFVAKMAGEHYEVARELLLKKMHVLVEKPFVFYRSQADELIKLAKEQNRTLMIGHEFTFAQNFHFFSRKIKQYIRKVSGLEVIWYNPVDSKKWGSKKSYDLSSNIVLDLYPHVLSQLEVFFGKQKVTLKSLTSYDKCWGAVIDITYGAIPVRIKLDKLNKNQERKIRVKSDSGDELIFDFLKEPGLMFLNGKPLDEKMDNTALGSSLISEMAYFFRQINEPLRIETPTLAGNSLNIIDAVDSANRALVRQQLSILEDYLWREHPKRPSDSILSILRFQTVVNLLRYGLIKNPKNTSGIDRWISMILFIVDRFSKEPWTTQKDILSGTGLEKNVLKKVNSVIRNSYFLQELIIHRGMGMQYWGTALQLIRSGAKKDVLAERCVSLPYNTGIYSGVSCMFNCTFCGRNSKAAYPASAVSAGNEVFLKIFKELSSHKNMVISFSGGLEPLTNPGIGMLFKKAKSYGFYILLMTNAFMLTEAYLEKQPDIWNLDVLRVSLYGVDEENYFKVTARKGAFRRIVKNIISFLELRNSMNTAVKLGINFIIQKNRSQDILPLLDLIGKINGEVKNGRGIDFLSLREDFSLASSEGVSMGERKRLIGFFKVFKRRLQEEPKLGSLKVNYGYSLYALSQACIGRPIVKVKHTEMRPKAFPQISVVIDLLGDVYAYREAGFLERPGAQSYKIGKVTKDNSLHKVIREFLESRKKLKPKPGDNLKFLDAFDSVITKMLNQAENDVKNGFATGEGPINEDLGGNKRSFEKAIDQRYISD